MKLLITLLTGLFSLFGLQSYSQVQCQGGSGNCTVEISNVQAVATNITPTPDGCLIKLNVTFDLTANGGFKFINMYFYNGSTPDAVCGGQEPSTSNSPNLGAYLVLNDINDGPGLDYVKTSDIKNGISPRTDYTYSVTSITNGVRVSLQGFLFSKTGSCSASPLTLHVGGANAGSNTIQCYGSYGFVAYQMLLRGLIGCSGPRNYNATLSTDYAISGLAPVSGTYDVYIDTDINGSVSSGDSLLINNQSFSTSVSSTTNTAIFSSTYGSDFITGDRRSDKNLIFRLKPTTTGVAGLDALVLNPCSPLPVTLKNFTAKLNGDKVMLNWETAYEYNNKGFEIQRRVNAGSSYEKVAFVDAKAVNGLGATYTFADAAKFRGSVAYRIVQQDLDGKLTYSDIRVVNVGGGKLQMMVYPNPSKGSARVALPTQSGKVDISLEDFAGKTIQRWTGFSASTLQLDQLRPGIYLIRVRIQETGEQIIERLIVQ